MGNDLKPLPFVLVSGHPWRAGTPWLHCTTCVACDTLRVRACTSINPNRIPFEATPHSGCIGLFLEAPALRPCV